MTDYRVRTDQEAKLPDPSYRVLDWIPGQTSATIQIGKKAGSRFLDGWRAPRPAVDLFLLGAAAYCIDKTTLREEAEDLWTRDLLLELPVEDPDSWLRASWPTALNFLTGDHWDIRPYQEAGSPLAGLAHVPEDVTPVADVDAVCLFSGGLDSLTGVIDLLEEDTGRRLCLLSHNEGDQSSTAQQNLFGELVAHYGPGRLTKRTLFLRPAPANRAQARPLPHDREHTTRARSLLFLTAGLALAASVGPDIPLYIPENGFIGINVPLTRARSGSYSTRTTHPYFIKSVQTAARTVGVTNPIRNPFRLKTKGQILAGTLNTTLLKSLAPMSISCSHPEAPRWAGKEQGNCGYCFPCLIRRASMAHVGWDTANDYQWDAQSGLELLDRKTQRSADLRAVINGTFAERPDRDILRNGPIPDGEHADFIRVWRGGLAELRAWFDGATLETKALLDRRT